MDTVNKVRSAIMLRARGVMAGTQAEKQVVSEGDRVTTGKDWAAHHGSSYPGITTGSKGLVVSLTTDHAKVRWDSGTTMNACNGHSGLYCLQLVGDEIDAIEGVTQEFIDASARNFIKGQSNYDQSVKDMQISLFAYTKVFTKIVLDTIPKLIWSELMYTVSNGRNTELSSFIKDALSNHETLAALMAEDHVKVQQRKRKELTVTRFKDSLKILRTIK